LPDITPHTIAIADYFSLVIAQPRLVHTIVSLRLPSFIISIIIANRIATIYLLPLVIVIYFQVIFSQLRHFIQRYAINILSPLLKPLLFNINRSLVIIGISHICHYGWLITSFISTLPPL